jgi:hypothetical protein
LDKNAWLAFTQKSLENNVCLPLKVFRLHLLSK